MDAESSESVGVLERYYWMERKNLLFKKAKNHFLLMLKKNPLLFKGYFRLIVGWIWLFALWEICNETI